MKRLISILALAFLVACSKEPMPQISFETSFTLNSAKEIYHAHIAELTIPDLFLSSNNTKSSDLLSDNSYNILWEQAEQHKDDLHYTYEIPLRAKQELMPVLFKYGNDTIHKIMDNVEIHSSLVIQKIKNCDSVNIFVNSVIGKITGEIEAVCNPWKFTGDKSSLYGYQILSDAEGNNLSGSYFYNGGNIYKLSLRKENLQEVQSIPQHFFGVYPILNTKGKVWPGLSKICDCGYLLVYGDVYCPGCREPVVWDVVIGDYCYKCDSDPCICPGPDDGCRYCGIKDCIGECRYN